MSKAEQRLDPATPKISIHNLHTTYRSGRGVVTHALDGIDFKVTSGEFVSIIGASGCGKTTLLRIVGGFETPDEGAVDIAEGTVPGGLVTSTVFQEDSAFPWLTVEQNVGYGLRIRGVPTQRRAELVDYFVDKVGLAAFRKAYPSQLSGGMRQRVSVARAFANEPEVLLMDEPFGALDEQTRLVLQDEILRLWNEHRRTVLFVTHNLDEAITLSDRILVLSARPGRVRAVIPVDIPRPRNVIAMRGSAKYGELYQQLWMLLREDIAAAEALVP